MTWKKAKYNQLIINVSCLLTKVNWIHCTLKERAIFELPLPLCQNESRWLVISLLRREILKRKTLGTMGVFKQGRLFQKGHLWPWQQQWQFKFLHVLYSRQRSLTKIFGVRCECLPRLHVQLKGTTIQSRCRRF